MSQDILPDLSPEEVRKAKKRASNHAWWVRNHARLVAQRRGYLRDYHLRHREQILVQQRAREKKKRAENPVEVRAKEKIRRERARVNAPEKVRARGKRYRDKRKALTGTTTHPGSKEYRARHKVSLAQKALLYRQQHADESRAHCAKRRARKRNAPVNDFTAKQWRAMCRAAGYRCAYCQRKFAFKDLTQDHITPLSKGGSHTYANILPACRSCNSRKNAGEVLMPVQPFLLIDEGAAD